MKSPRYLNLIAALIIVVEAHEFGEAAEVRDSKNGKIYELVSERPYSTSMGSPFYIELSDKATGVKEKYYFDSSLQLASGVGVAPDQKLMALGDKKGTLHFFH